MEEKLNRLEAAVLLQFITESGMEYLYEYADDFQVNIDALIEKLRSISV